MQFKSGQILSKDIQKHFKLELENQIFVFWKVGGQAFGCFFDSMSFSNDSLKKISSGAITEIKVVFPQSLAVKVENSFQSFDASILKFIQRSTSHFEVVFDAASGRLFVADLEDSKEEKKELKVMIIDDSPTIQSLLDKTFSSTSDLKVVAKAKLPSEAEALIQEHQPDVITLDLHMPEMNGVELFNQVIKRYQIPTIIISSVSIKEGPLVIEALNSGAIDYLQKPTIKELPIIKDTILEKVRTAARSKPTFSPGDFTPQQSSRCSSVGFHPDSMVVIGSSTGGVQALEVLLAQLPNKIPPTMIVQHIPAVFSKALADRLDKESPFTIKEAEDGEVVKENCIYIAPGGKQMAYRKRGPQHVLLVNDDPPMNKFQPSVDYFFSSLAKSDCSKVVSVILTGMGKDGAMGMKLLKERGAQTIAQDEASSAVFGMPKAAIELGVVDKVLDIKEIASGISDQLGKTLSSKNSEEKKAV